MAPAVDPVGELRSKFILAMAAAMDATLDVFFDNPVSQIVGAGAMPSNTFHPVVGGANSILPLEEEAAEA